MTTQTISDTKFQRANIISDHTFAAWLRKQGWKGDCNGIGGVNAYVVGIAPNRRVVALEVCDNVKCTTVRYLLKELL